MEKKYLKESERSEAELLSNDEGNSILSNKDEHWRWTIEIECSLKMNAYEDH